MELVLLIETSPNNSLSKGWQGGLDSMFDKLIPKIDGVKGDHNRDP